MYEYEDRRSRPREQHQLDRIEDVLHQLKRSVRQMAISQEQFDADLAGLLSSFDELLAAVEVIANKPPEDLTTEDQAVLDATTKLKAELEKLNPSTPPVDTGTPPVE